MRATRLRRGYGAPSIGGLSREAEWSFRESDIEGKAAMGSGKRAGTRASFKRAGASKSIRPVADKLPELHYYDSTQFGLRFSLNAAMPSRDSADSRACM
jgi:hypothetical protein